MDAQPDAAHGLPDAFRLRKRLHKIPAALPEHIDLTAPRGSNHLRGGETFPYRRLETPMVLLREAPRVFFVYCCSHHVRARHCSHFGSTLNAAVPPNRHQAGFLPTHIPLGELQVDDG